MRNPFTRIQQRFSRYLAIAVCTGTISFIVALILLHMGFSPFLSLLISVVVSGLASYAALEMWATPKRKGALSWRRLLASTLVGAAAFVVRWGALTYCLRIFHSLAPLDNVLALSVAYVLSFGFGYLLRSRMVFTRIDPEPTVCDMPPAATDAGYSANP